jgi:hypothetical protein
MGIRRIFVAAATLALLVLGSGISEAAVRLWRPIW